jgi:hypothetical protein
MFRITWRSEWLNDLERAEVEIGENEEGGDEGKRTVTAIEDGDA